MTKIPEDMPAYTYGTAAVSPSSISLRELEDLKVSVGLTADDERYLRRAGEVLQRQTREIVARWRSGIIASIPNLARHSRSPSGEPLPNFWLRATCVLSNGFWIPACVLTIRTG
jgi:hypothetical protein